MTRRRRALLRDLANIAAQLADDEAKVLPTIAARVWVGQTSTAASTSAMTAVISARRGSRSCATAASPLQRRCCSSGGVWGAAPA